MLTCSTNSHAEVFVGTSAGSQMYSDIKKAQGSVRVISPYLSDHLVEVLLGCQERGLAVRAIVSDDRGNARDLARLLVVQTVQIDADRQRLSHYGAIFSGLSLVVAVALLGWAVVARASATAVAALLLGLFMTLLFLYVRKLAIYVYSYSYRLGGLRVVPSPRCYPYEKRDSAPPFVHAKLYVIDDRVAYVGSANFTNSGLFDNLETMVRLTSADAVAALGRFIDELLTHGQLPVYPPELWARPFFREHRGMVAGSRAVPAMPPPTRP